MKPETAKKLLEENLRIYDKIAKEFARTREGKWQELLPFGELAQDGARILDTGCGSGRVYGIFKDRAVEYFGIDTSPKLIEIAKERFKDFPRAHFLSGDLLDVPFPDEYFDAVYSVAALHHIPGTELRAKAIQEFYRLLKPGGKLVMTNWYWWRPPAVLIVLKYWLKKLCASLLKYAVPRHSNILQNVGMTMDLDLGDIFVPWGKKGLRYYHSFRKRELEKLLRQTGFKNIKQRIQYRKGDHWGKRNNLITIAEK